MTESPTPPALRVVVCDDDPVVRQVISGIVADLGGEVIAETDTATETAALATRFRPDLIVLDLQLRHGTGREVIAELAGRAERSRVVVFTAHDELAPLPTEGVDVIHKPDFEGLARCIATVPDRSVERRRPMRAVPWADHRRIDDPAGFSRDLMTARPGDVLVSIRVDGVEPDHVVDVLQRAVRAQDRLLKRSTDVLVLLIDGGEGAAPALRDRVIADLPDVDDRLRAVDVDHDPVAAFTRLDG